jgi:hypothetical protein
MTNRTVPFLLALVIAFALLTWLFGWWGVAVLAVVAGAFASARDGRPWITALAAALAWGALMLTDAMGGRFSALSSSLAGVMRLPATALVLATVTFAALLAWSGAVIGGELGRLATRGRSRTT